MKHRSLAAALILAAPALAWLDGWFAMPLGAPSRSTVPPEVRRALEEVQKIHDREIAEVAKTLEHKEKEILTV